MKHADAHGCRWVGERRGADLGRETGVRYVNGGSLETGRESSSRGAYDTVPIEDCLRRASRGAWPFDVPTLSRAWIDPALDEALRRPGNHVEVRVPWRRRFTTTPRGDTLSFISTEIPSPVGAPVRMIVLAASSESVASLVSNLMLGLRVAGGRADELVKALEERRRAGKMFMQAVACIPGSVKG